MPVRNIRDSLERALGQFSDIYEDLQRGKRILKTGSLARISPYKGFSFGASLKKLSTDFFKSSVKLGFVR
jgi:hypothetical protein